LLRKLGHDTNEVAGFEKYCSSDFAPTSVERRLNNILKGYFGETKPKMLLKSDILVEKVETPTPSVKKVKREDDPPIIAAIRREEQQCRDDRKALHLTLDNTVDDAERAEKCFSIRALTGRIDAIWNIIFAYEGTGTLPAIGSVGEEKTATEEVMDLKLRQYSLRSRLTRLKQKLENKDLATSLRIRYTREQGEKQSEMDGINQKLSTIKAK
jgi:hypothetical protein